MVELDQDAGALARGSMLHQPRPPQLHARTNATQAHASPPRYPGRRLSFRHEATAVILHGQHELPAFLMQPDTQESCPVRVLEGIMHQLLANAVDASSEAGASGCG